MSNLADLVRQSAAARPDHPALITPSTQLTWAQVDARVDRGARALADSGLEPGSRVALMIGNRPEFAIAYFAVLRAGLVAVPLNTGYTAAEVVRLCNDAGAQLLLHDAARVKVGATVAKRAAGTRAVGLESPQGQALVGVGPGGRGAFSAPRTRPRDLAVLMYTSGSEGQPKGAMLSHGALRANVDALARIKRPAAIEPDDRLLLVLPMFHIYGLNAGLGLAARVGATCVLLERFEPRAALRHIRELEVTSVVGAPAMYVSWSAEGSLRESMDGVRLLVSGASALPPDVFAQFATITGKPIWEGYGLTECCPVVTTTMVSKRPKPGSVGRPLAGVQVSLRDTGGSEVLEGDPGEVWVKARSLLSGYWPDASGGVDAEGWFHTGDVAILDGDGDFRLVDRRRDLIIVSGFNVYPREVEAVMSTHPAITEVAVIGVPHPLTGESVKAVVVLRKGVPDPADLRAFCEARLARFKCPSIIEFATRLPRAATGRITKGKLKDARV
ncbi:MAG: AMP-binding protein [Candidatus Nanopelagicales bacterium]